MSAGRSHVSVDELLPRRPVAVRHARALASDILGEGPPPAGDERNGGPWIRLIVPDASHIDFYDGEDAPPKD